MVPVFAFTFSEHISPIMYNNCTSCHREGQIGAGYCSIGKFNSYLISP